MKRCLASLRFIFEYGTLDKENLSDNEFAGGADIVEIFGDDIAGFQKIMAVVASINQNAMKEAA